MSDITIALGKKIRALRQARNWTQEQLAEYAELHVSYIVLLEKGANRATIETLEKLAKAFGISISDLVQSLDDARDDPVQKQIRDLMEDFIQKIDAVYRQ